MDKNIKKQIKLSLQEANLICFLVSAKEGLMNEDYEIAKQIRLYNKDVLVIINKIDGLNYNLIQSEFFSLKFPYVHAVSATNGIGINKLIEKYFLNFFRSSLTHNDKKSYFFEILEKEKENTRVKNHVSCIKIAIVGKPNVGKSTFVNYVLNENRMVTDNIPGTTRDNVWSIASYKNNNYIFIDTAGVRKKNKVFHCIEKLSIKKTFNSIKIANIVILMLDITNTISNQDITLFNYIINSGCGIIIVINKCDKISRIEKKMFIKSQKMKIMNVGIIHFISSINGLGINKIFESIEKTFENSIKDIKPSKLTEIMELAVKNHKPPIIKGYKIKLKYAHLGNKNPLTIIIHGKNLQYLTKTYKKYLLNFFIKRLKLTGNSIHFFFKENNTCISK
ncbi:MAG: ribosome biogenesis GTPase Der [Buchnera aphidicola (Nurudea shiraii)]